VPCKPVTAELGNVSPVIIVPGQWSIGERLYQAEELGTGPPDALPWTFIRGIELGRTADICFSVESFYGQCAETSLTAPSVAAFVNAATSICNDVVWGTLSTTILVSPGSLRADAEADSVERAVADLRYGAIEVIAWHALAFAIGTTTWGAYPGRPRTDIQFGSGVVGNAAMFDRPQKSVVRGPFRVRPRPPWFATSTGQLGVMRRFVAFEADPSAAKFPGLLLAALRR
jgi:hypothetical protein